MDVGCNLKVLLMKTFKTNYKAGMYMKKKMIYASFLAASLAAGVVVAEPKVEAATFSDVHANDYFYEAVTKLSEKGIISGYNDGTFKPYQNVTRGQAAKIIANAIGLDVKNVANPHFSDVPITSEYYGAIAALANKGIISGYSDGTFKPNAFVQRYHIAKILVKAFDLQSPHKGSDVLTLPFTDIENSEYEEYIDRLYVYNITSGTTPTTFGGNSYITRGQLAKFVLKCKELNETPNKMDGNNHSTNNENSVPAYTTTPDGKKIPNPAIDYEGYLKAMEGMWEGEDDVYRVDGPVDNTIPIDEM